jgi:hypothetical protein
MSAEGRVAPGMMSFSGAVSEYGARQGRKVGPNFCLSKGVYPKFQGSTGVQTSAFCRERNASGLCVLG